MPPAPPAADSSVGPRSDGDAPPLRVSDLTVAYHRKPVLERASCTVPAGSLTAIVGPNGAGKSTLLKAALGLIPAATGGATFWGQPLKKVRGRVGYVPQRSEVDWDFPITAAGVVEMGLYREIGWLWPVGSSHRARAAEALGRVGLAEFAHRQIARLSGGQQQRVFLARALVQGADLYLMDEPFAGVDAATERAIVDLLHELRDAGKSVLAVHHDLSTVPEYFDRAILLNKTVRAAGPVDEVFTAEVLKEVYGGRLAVLDSSLSGGSPSPLGGAPLDAVD
ncbi:Vitamin B12 import ATP-binding protein BtuD [Planctomycetes bacterium LzC2]|uniref:Vitamin B12 import ATP-binding protein BtuD n=1 Tax=Alienimonas chondri TaxID=2681879 RepID=A0ABX1VJP9_9PLAN|nr:Vitamin B12 import ATP-binding protein BtuD [Alienimonas chondri]